MKTSPASLFVTAALAALLFAATLAAQTLPVADVALSVEMEPADGVTPPGSTGTLTFTLVNHGPDPGGLSGSGVVGVGDTGYAIIENYGIPIVYERVAGSPCILFQDTLDPGEGDPYYVIFEFFVDGMQPGESRVCQLQFHINSLVTEDFTDSWSFRLFYEVDPDISNNRVHLNFHLTAPSVTEIPTLSRSSLIVLFSILASAGVLLMRRRRQYDQAPIL